MKCNHYKCDTIFGPLNHRYTCSICNNKYCDSHTCNTSYISHLRGLKLYKIDDVNKNGKYICNDCFDKYGPNDISIRNNIFDRTCHIDDCNNDLDSLLTLKYSCISCGRISCKTHSISIDKVPHIWKEENTNYPLSNSVCTTCFCEKNAKQQSDSQFHEKAVNLRLSAGKRDGARKAILIHGILSNSKKMEVFSSTLERSGLFDSIWLLDDLAYQGRVNEAKRLSINDIPIGLDLRKIGLSAAKIASNKAYQTIDIPGYIVEGAARNLASTVKLLGWNDVTLVGHSLGGMVARCAVESFDLSKHISNVITMGSPFKIWQTFNNTKYWDFTPNKKINYLVILGSKDWVTTHRHLGNLTDDDNKYNNILKVMIPDLDHTSIHDKANTTYMSDLIRGFINGSIFDDKSEFFIRRENDKSFACFVGIHGKAHKNDAFFDFSGEWVEFSDL